MKLINKKAIYSKNSFMNTKPSTKFSFNNKNNSTNIRNFTTKEKKLIIQNNLKKYNTTLKKYNKYIINAIIFDQRNHIVSVFKNYLLWDETSEFLKRYYRKKDNSARLPKIAEYYEKYTLFTPNYFGNEGLIILIMIKFMKRKKKYLKYLEDREDEEDNDKNKKNVNKDFEPLIKNEIFAKSKSLFSSFLDFSKHTLELTNYDNELTYYINKIETKRKSTNKIITEKNLNKLDINEQKMSKNSMSFTEIFDDLSSHFSVLINSNSYKDYIQKTKKIPIKSLTNKANLTKKEINQKNNHKILSIKNIKQKTLSRRQTPNKQQNEIKNENNNLKSKDIHKVSKYKKLINAKKIVSIKEYKNKEKEKNNELNEKEKEKIITYKEIRKNPQQHLTNNLNNKQKENNLSKNIINKKNINIISNNNSKNNQIIKFEDKSNIMNTITNIKSQYNSIGKFVKNKKQRSAIKKVNIKSLNLINLNQNIIPNLKKIVNPKKERRIIFPRNANNIYNNNTNKLNSIKGENFEHIKLLTDRDKENITLVNNTNENSKLIKLNDNMFLYNNQNNNIINHKRHKIDMFPQKIGKLIKKKNISLNADNSNNLSSKDINNRNSLIYKNEKRENNAMMNINNNLNNINYKKNSVLRQFNSKKDFNFNSKNNILYNYNNISNNSMNSSSSSSLNNLNKKRYKLSNNGISQNNSINKNRKSLQKINLNLNLQINLNINIDKKNKKLILAQKLNNRLFGDVNNKNNKIQNNKGNSSNSNSNINGPFTQRCYYNINNKGYKFMGNYRSSSSSNSKKKKKGRINI